MNFHINASHHRTAALCKIAGGACGGTVKSEGVVAGVGEVAAPQTDGGYAELHVGMGPKQGIHLLLILPWTERSRPKRTHWQMPLLNGTV